MEHCILDRFRDFFTDDQFGFKNAQVVRTSSMFYYDNVATAMYRLIKSVRYTSDPTT